MSVASAAAATIVAAATTAATIVALLHLVARVCLLTLLLLNTNCGDGVYKVLMRPALVCWSRAARSGRLRRGPSILSSDVACIQTPGVGRTLAALDKAIVQLLYPPRCLTEVAFLSTLSKILGGHRPRECLSYKISTSVQNIKASRTTSWVPSTTSNRHRTHGVNGARINIKI